MTKKIYIFIVFHALIFSLNASESIIQSCQEFNKEAIESVIKRIIPAQANRFIVERIEAEDGKDAFELYSRNHKIVLAGNTGVSVTSALNHYLKYYCYKEYSWTNMNPVTLKELPPVTEKIRKVSPYKYRYYLNYVTFNYTAAWWDWDRWEKELDWMALHGINMPLAVMGQDAVWQRVYRNLGFTGEQIGPFQSGAAYSYYQSADILPAWEYMLSAAQELGNNNSFQYDLLDLTRQVAANYSNELQEEYRQAFNEKDIDRHRAVSKHFLELIDDMDAMMATRKEFMFGPWVEAARAWGTNSEEKDLYERNARNLLTLWHGPEYRNLDDYACRQWAGLLGEYYKTRWAKFVDYTEGCLLKNEKTDMNKFASDLRKWQWDWIHQHTEHAVEPKGNVVELSRQMYNKYKDRMRKAFSQNSF